MGGPGPLKTMVCHRRACRNNYIQACPRRAQNEYKVVPQMEPKSINNCFGSFLENSGTTCPKSDKHQRTRVSKGSSEINKKGVLKTPSHSYGSPWVPMGSQGPLLMDFGEISESLLLDSGGYFLYILGVFYYHSLRRFPVPLVSTGSGKLWLCQRAAGVLHEAPAGVLGGRSPRRGGKVHLRPRPPFHSESFW